MTNRADLEAALRHYAELGPAKMERAALNCIRDAARLTANRLRSPVTDAVGQLATSGAEAPEREQRGEAPLGPFGAASTEREAIAQIILSRMVSPWETNRAGDTADRIIAEHIDSLRKEVEEAAFCFEQAREALAKVERERDEAWDAGATAMKEACVQHTRLCRRCNLGESTWEEAIRDLPLPRRPA